MYVSQSPYIPKKRGELALLIILALIEFGRLASSLYAYEVALHVNHNTDEFKAPFSAKSLKSYSFIDMHAPSTAYCSMIRTIIQAAQGLLDTFIGLSTFEMLALPPHIYAGRVIYAVILLMKLHKALLASVCGLNEDISVGQLRLEAYIERLLLISKRLNAEDGSSSLSRAFLIMPQLKQWLHDQITKSTFAMNENSVLKEMRAEDGACPSVPANTNPAELPQRFPDDADRQVSGCSNCSNLLGALGSQPDDPFAQDAIPERAVDTLNRDLASDSWFVEFFNVDML